MRLALRYAYSLVSEVRIAADVLVISWSGRVLITFEFVSVLASSLLEPPLFGALWNARLVLLGIRAMKMLSWHTLTCVINSRRPFIKSRRLQLS